MVVWRRLPWLVMPLLLQVGRLRRYNCCPLSWSYEHIGYWSGYVIKNYAVQDLVKAILVGMAVHISR